MEYGGDRYISTVFINCKRLELVVSVRKRIKQPLGPLSVALERCDVR